jgi:hypothetical protein
MSAHNLLTPRDLALQFAVADIADIFFWKEFKSESDNTCFCVADSGELDVNAGVT